ncbi:hypothetical protein N7510_010391 [Penicillium lagena]|uniref:uncharacterized protein n=1 Tax=Penicillium lagena TaxID=94218 RepID=UPI002540DF72|nr:uncharacterized protein N7510_010391 [Penicillium lagena]KAJ5605237.1 hypothetical protein N7510_010391 [Penicillium lagena]
MIQADSAEDGDIPSVQIIYEPSQVWSHHVIPLVLGKFSVKVVDTSRDSSLFATIPRLITSTQEGSPVYAVCDAIACAYLASMSGSADAIANRTRAYGTALRVVNVALGSEEGNRHCRGMASLIDLRDPEQFTRDDGRNLVCKPKHLSPAGSLLQK